MIMIMDVYGACPPHYTLTHVQVMCRAMYFLQRKTMSQSEEMRNAYLSDVNKLKHLSAIGPCHARMFTLVVRRSKALKVRPWTGLNRSETRSVSRRFAFVRSCQYSHL